MFSEEYPSTLGSAKIENVLQNVADYEKKKLI